MLDSPEPPYGTGPAGASAGSASLVTVLVPRRLAPWQSMLCATLERDRPVILDRGGGTPPTSGTVLDLRSPFGPAPAGAGETDAYAVRFGRPRAAGAPPFFQDVLARDHAVLASLVLRAGGCERLVRHGYFAARITYGRSMRDAAPEVATWLPPATATPGGRDARDPAAGLPRAEPAHACELDPATTRNRLRALALTARFRFRRLVRGIVRPRSRWAVGTIEAPVETLLARTPPVRWLAPHDGFLADPFPAPEPGGRVFCERLGPGGKGEIVALDLAGTAPPQPVLALDVHLSYPYVASDGGATFLIPEMHAAHRIDAFRLDPATGRPTFARTLLDIDACDSTFVRHAGRWWLFCSRASSLPDANLYLYHADALAGPWTAHARNPVKTDVRGARPGGMPFVAGGRLYRPAQDCSLSYGGALVLQRIETLTPDEFAETPVRRIEPDPAGPFSHGLHTLSWRGERCFVDGRIDALG